MLLFFAHLFIYSVVGCEGRGFLTFWIQLSETVSFKFSLNSMATGVIFLLNNNYQSSHSVYIIIMIKSFAACYLKTSYFSTSLSAGFLSINNFFTHKMLCLFSEKIVNLLLAWRSRRNKGAFLFFSEITRLH